MQFSFGKGLMAGAAGTAILLAITAAASGHGPGAVFNLGRTNGVDATSTLAGTTRGPMLTVTNSGRGTALNLRVSHGRAPFSVNSATKVAGLNASLLGGIAPSGFVQGGGHTAIAQIELNQGQSATLLDLGAYGTFKAFCVTAPLAQVDAELDFDNGTHPVHLWLQDLTTTSGSFSEQDLSPGSSLSIQNTSAEQIRWTIQIGGSHKLNAHVATVESDETVINGVCDLAVIAHAGP